MEILIIVLLILLILCILRIVLRPKQDNVRKPQHMTREQVEKTLWLQEQRKKHKRQSGGVCGGPQTSLVDRREIW